MVWYFGCKLLSSVRSNSAEDYHFMCLNLLLWPGEITETPEAMTWFLKYQEQHSGSENWMASVPRMYSGLEPYQLLAIVVQRNPTPQLKATPWKSIYRTALLAQDENPVPGLESPDHADQGSFFWCCLRKQHGPNPADRRIKLCLRCLKSVCSQTIGRITFKMKPCLDPVSK